VRTVWWNLGFSLLVILTLITSVFVAGLSLPLGVVGHEGSTLVVCANGLRLLRTPRWARSVQE
jgi:Cd2+/Zn2+-exporting ATPase